MNPRELIARLNVPARRRNGRLYEFEGVQASVREIRAMVPCLSPACIRGHLEAGRNTRTAMLTFDFKAARKNGGRNGARKTRGSFVI